MSLITPENILQPVDWIVSKVIHWKVLCIGDELFCPKSKLTWIGIFLAGHIDMVFHMKYPLH